MKLDIILQKDDDSENNYLVYFEEDGVISNILAQKIETNLYFLLESSLFTKVYKYGMQVEIELKEHEEPELKGEKKWIKKIVKESSFETFTHILNEEFIQSGKSKKLQNLIVQFGGEWHIDIGGILSIHIPKNRINDLQLEWQKIK